MPMNLLWRLAQSDMPATVTDNSDILQLQILISAGHVFASIPFPRATNWCWHQDAATVHCVTPLGYKVLRWFGPEDCSRDSEKDHDY